VLGTRDDSGRKQYRENAFQDDHDEALLVVLSLFKAGIEIDPALGRPVVSADST
jgi:hypothetical protein